MENDRVKIDYLISEDECVFKEIFTEKIEYEVKSYSNIIFTRTISPEINSEYVETHIYYLDGEDRFEFRHNEFTSDNYLETLFVTNICASTRQTLKEIYDYIRCYKKIIEEMRKQSNQNFLEIKYAQKILFREQKTPIRITSIEITTR